MTRKEQGFSLIEALITLVVFAIFMIAVFALIIHYTDVTKTEQARVRLNQESRFFLSSFASEIKNVGATINLSHTGTFLSQTEAFTGISPLNNADFPDGIIVASGDPYVVTRLSSQFAPGAGSATAISVETTMDKHGMKTLWNDGDIGIVISPFIEDLTSGGNTTGGYYVFKVNTGTGGSIPSTQLPIRETAVYYSGLLNDGKYKDEIVSASGAPIPNGRATVYPTNAPVIRLTSFAIYAFRQQLPSKIMQFVRIADTQESATPIADMENGTVVGGIISENIVDMQIAYKVYRNQHPYTSNPDNFTKDTYFDKGGGVLYNLQKGIREQKLKNIDVRLIALTDDYGGIKQTGPLDTLPALADRPALAFDLPVENKKYTFRIIQLAINMRNYGTVI